MAESEEHLKSLLMKVKEESEKVGLNLNIQKLRSWHLVPSHQGNYKGKQLKRGKNEKSNRFYFLGLQITVDGDFSHEIKRHLIPGRKVITNLDNVLKRDITLLTKVCVVKDMFIPVVMTDVRAEP